MPHKRNPIVSERICGLARLLRGNAMAAMENNALWHERDISHSSVERVICPDSTITLDYMLTLSISLMDNLIVYQDTMKSNIEKTYGLVFSQTILLELIRRGCTREEGYAIVQRSAMKTWSEKVLYLKIYYSIQNSLLLFLNKIFMQFLKKVQYYIKVLISYSKDVVYNISCNILFLLMLVYLLLLI